MDYLPCFAVDSKISPSILTCGGTSFSSILFCNGFSTLRYSDIKERFLAPPLLPCFLERQRFDIVSSFSVRNLFLACSTVPHEDLFFVLMRCRNDLGREL